MICYHVDVSYLDREYRLVTCADCGFQYKVTIPRRSLCESGLRSDGTREVR